VGTAAPIRNSRLRSLRRSFSRLLFERRYGLSTADHVDYDELGYEDGERYRYEPSGWLSLRRALPRRRVSETDVFVDLGSGKGRVVFQAARHYPFKRVIGVELSSELHEVARGNIESHRRGLRCQDVELVNDDVLEWEIPADLTIVYMHNPFLGRLFSQVAERLVRFAHRHRRRLFVIYVNPVEHERLVAIPGVRELPPPRGLLARVTRSEPGSIRLYEIEPHRA
jgi:hypothetical protein